MWYKTLDDPWNGYKLMLYSSRGRIAPWLDIENDL